LVRCGTVLRALHQTLAQSKIEKLNIPKFLKERDVRPRIGLGFVYLDFKINNVSPKLISGTLDVRHDRGLPIPTLGVQLRRWVSGNFCSKEFCRVTGLVNGTRCVTKTARPTSRNQASRHVCTFTIWIAASEGLARFSVSNTTITSRRRLPAGSETWLGFHSSGARVRHRLQLYILMRHWRGYLQQPTRL